MVAKLSDRIEGLPYNGVKVGDPVSLLENDVPYAKESQLVNENLLINGGFDVWQRGTSFAQTGSSAYTADRWIKLANGSVDRYKYPSGSVGAGYVLNLSGNNTYIGVSQIIENASYLDGKTVTLSFRHAAIVPTVGSYVNLQFKKISDGTSIGTNRLVTGWGSTSAAYFREEITVTLDNLPENVTDNSDVALEVSIFATRASAEVCDVRISDVKLEIGDIATPYRARPIAEELALCLRYYQSLTRDLTQKAYTTNGSTLEYIFPVEMRSVPAMTYVRFGYTPDFNAAFTTGFQDSTTTAVLGGTARYIASFTADAEIY